MIKRLMRHGNSTALLIERPILELLGWDKETDLEVKTDGKKLTISRAPNLFDQSEDKGASHLD